MRRDAHIDGDYRYWLLRDWSGRPVTSAFVSSGRAYVPFGVLWVMLNPSTADHDQDDPTIRKCIGFTRRLGHNSLVVVNLFAYRATDPRDLMFSKRPATFAGGSWWDHIVGPENDGLIANLATQASLIICAWGAYAGLGREMEVRIRAVHRLLEASAQGIVPLRALGFSKAGEPRHPLMMPYYAASELHPWPGAACRR